MYNKYLENYILNINKETYKANDKRNELRDIIISKLFRYFFAMENFIMFWMILTIIIEKNT